MEVYMRATGSVIRPTVVVDLSMLTEISTMECGVMIRLMDSESTLTLTVADTLEPGSMTFRKVRVKKCGLMEPTTRANIRTVKNMLSL